LAHHIRQNRSLQVKWLFLALLAIALLIIIPTWNPPTLPFDTLDGGYRAVLNDQSLQHLSYGTELVTTSGPLGFLRNHDYWPGRFGQKLAWNLLIALAFAASVVRLLQQRSLSCCVIFAAALYAVLSLVQLGAFWVLPCLHVLYFTSRLCHRDWIDSVVGGVAVIGLSVASWVLFSHLLLALAVVTFGEALHYLRRGGMPVLGVLYVCCTLAWWIAMGQRLGALFPYLSASMEVANGYTRCMQRAGGFMELLPLCLSFALLAAGLALWRTEGRYPHVQRALAVLAVAAVAFISYRSAFVRFETLRSLAASVTATVLALWLATHFSKESEGQRKVLIAAMVALVVAYVGAVHILVISERIHARPYVLRALKAPSRSLRSFLNVTKTRELIKSRHERMVAAARKRFRLGGIKGPVDMHGNLQGLMIANQLELTPRPVFQSFDAFTPRLIRMNGDYVRSPDGPQQIVVELQRSIGFPEGLSDADAWLALFEGYEVQKLIDAKFDKVPHGLLVVRRSAAWRPYERVLVSAGEYALGETIEIPPAAAGRPIWAEIDERLTLRGHLGAAFLKLPTLFIQFEFEESWPMRFKISTAPARHGFLMSPQIRSVGELAQRMRDGLEKAPAKRRVASFRIWQEPTHPLAAAVRSALIVKLYTLERAVDHGIGAAGSEVAVVDAGAL
jgi:hypothetical protein